MTAPVVDITAAATTTAPATTPLARRTRPRTQYWDVFEARWVTRAPAVPTPRSGD